MLRSLIVSAARRTPPVVKKWVHHHRALDRWTRKIFSASMGLSGDVVTVQSGPLAGIRLAVSEHISHAHIRGTYEVETQHAVDRLVAPGFICYDLGASIGYLSLLMALKAKHVYAFEPAPHAANEIRRHAEVNGFTNISIVSSPVSNCVRTVEFSVTDVAYGSRIAPSGSKWPRLRLTTITLDDFITAHPFPDFVKIDVEDEEGRVLEGARSLLKARKALICCELHSEQSARQVHDILSEHGYQVRTLEGAPFQISGPVVPREVQVLGLPP